QRRSFVAALLRMTDDIPLRRVTGPWRGHGTVLPPALADISPRDSGMAEVEEREKAEKHEPDEKEEEKEEPSAPLSPPPSRQARASLLSLAPRPQPSRYPAEKCRLARVEEPYRARATALSPGAAECHLSS